jgi:hypothetical protein
VRLLSAAAAGSNVVVAFASATGASQRGLEDRPAITAEKGSLPILTTSCPSCFLSPQVRYRWSDSGGRGQLLREEIYRPRETTAAAAAIHTATAAVAAAGSSGRNKGGQQQQQPQQQQGQQQGQRVRSDLSTRKALVISTYAADSGELLLRSKQRCVMGKTTFRVSGRTTA